MSGETDTWLEGLRTGWEARITPQGKFRYYIVYFDGVMDGGYAWAWTPKRAERKARKGIARLKVEDARIAAAWTVGPLDEAGS